MPKSYWPDFRAGNDELFWLATYCPVEVIRSFYFYETICRKVSRILSPSSLTLWVSHEEWRFWDCPWRSVPQVVEVEGPPLPVEQYVELIMVPAIETWWYWLIENLTEKMDKEVTLMSKKKDFPVALSPVVDWEMCFGVWRNLIFCNQINSINSLNMPMTWRVSYARNVVDQNLQYNRPELIAHASVCSIIRWKPAMVTE